MITAYLMGQIDRQASSIHPCINPFTYLFVCISIYRSIYLSIDPSIYLSIYLSNLSIYLSIYLPICIYNIHTIIKIWESDGFWGTYVETNPNDPWLKTLPSKAFKQVQVIIGAVRPRMIFESAGGMLRGKNRIFYLRQTGFQSGKLVGDCCHMGQFARHVQGIFGLAFLPSLLQKIDCI